VVARASLGRASTFAFHSIFLLEIPESKFYQKLMRCKYMKKLVVLLVALTVLVTFSLGCNQSKQEPPKKAAEKAAPAPASAPEHK
jgi:hypothetical protein